MQEVPELDCPYKKCSVEGCDRIHESKGYCTCHAAQVRKYGKPITKGNYSYKTSRNDIKHIQDFCAMSLYNKLGEKVGVCLFDIEHKSEIEKYKWYLNKKGYVYSGKGGYLHRLILQLKKGEKYVADHINRDRLDNRKINIRRCSRSQNNMNSIVSQNNISGYKGVWWFKPTKRWVVGIGKDYNSIHLGYFDTKEEAALVYNEKAKELFGENARLNVI